MPLPKPKLLAGWRRAKLIALINELYYTSAFAVVAPVGLWSTRLRCPQIHRLDLFVTRWPSTRDAQRNQNSEPKLRPPAVSKSLTGSRAQAPVRPATARPHRPRCPQNPGRRCPARPLPSQGQALVGAALGIGMRQNVLAADLVVQGVEAIAGLRLRFRV